MAKHNDISAVRHSLAHLLGAAVLDLYPGSKLAIGPAIDDGFYYDIDINGKVSDTDLPIIEQKMREILKTWDKFEGKEVSPEEARKSFKENQFKEELVTELEDKGEKITLYTSGPPAGGFTDLCRGGHVSSAKDIDPKSFKLSHTAGAYWRGNENNPQLTRIYGLAFATKKELDAYVIMQEEAKKRDHKKLGPELDLFTFSELVGAGLPLWTPRGTLVRNLLDDYVWELRRKRGYTLVDIPHITRKDLYEKSGHWEKYKDDLFKIVTREGHLYAMKPMNCPHHIEIFKRYPHSYKELPQRYASTTKVYRDEQSGELAGLSRVLSITQDDAHVFCEDNLDQISEEINKIWDIIEEFYPTFGFNLKPRLSMSDPDNMQKYLGDAVTWKKSENMLRKIAESRTVNYFEAPGEAAFYGPKLDFMAKDSIGREWQVATIQLDRFMPGKLGAYYIDKEGTKMTPVMLHAAIMGSIERFLSVLIEHYAGAFPVWLSPVQAMVLPISDKQNHWAEKVFHELKANGIRVEIDKANETLGKKIRRAEMQKTPYILVVGEKEESAQAVAIRARGKGDQGQMKLGPFISKVKKEIENKV